MDKRVMQEMDKRRGWRDNFDKHGHIQCPFTAGCIACGCTLEQFVDGKVKECLPPLQRKEAVLKWYVLRMKQANDRLLTDLMGDLEKCQ